MKIAVVGATGLVGGVMLQVLQERGFADCEILAAASPKSVGKEIDFAGRKLTVMSVEDAIKAKPDYAVFSAGASTHSGPTGSKLRRTTNVIALDDTGRRGVIWSLKDAIPIRYELSPMDSSRSEVLTESVTFAIHGVDREASTLSLLWQAMEG